jgi:3-hydroxybutyryl-CoA dehydratase
MEVIMLGKSISELTIGEYAEFTKTIAESDIYLFAGITGDLNPAHINKEYAQNTFFKGRIAHGMLLAGFISAVIGCQLPGPGSIYIAQDLRFKAPARIGDTVQSSAVVKEIIREKNRVILETICKNQEGVVLLSGQATVSPPKKE